MTDSAVHNTLSSPNRVIWRLALPSILANITIPLVGIVDTAIVGHIGDISAVGGIAVGTMLFDLLYWNFGFLRISTSGMTAQAVGRHDSEGATRLLTQAVTTSLLSAALILLLQWFFVTAVLALMPCSAEVSAFARRYFFIRVWAAPATLTLMSLKGWFIGMQDTISPMVTDIVVNVVNMLASYLLAVESPVGAIGVAWGTLIAQYTGLLTAIVLLAVRYRSTLTSFLRPDFVRESMRWSQIRRLVTINVNLFIRSLCFMVVYVGYTIIASTYDDTELALSTIMMKIFMFFSFFVDGFAYAAEALCGRLGATDDGGWHKTDGVRQVVRILFFWALGVGVLFAAAYAFGSDQLIALMTNNAELQEAATRYYIWLALMPLISALAFLWDGVYIGATADFYVRQCMVWAAIAFVVSYFACYQYIGTQALYVAYFAHLAARTIYLSLKWHRLN